MLKKSIILVSALIFFVLPLRNAKAQNRYVYLVRASGCANYPLSRSLTGFKLKGTKGIITALHGVADCSTIAVTNAKGNPREAIVSVKDVDVARDLARISSPALEKLPAAGFLMASQINWKTLKFVKVVGYPLKVDLDDITTPLMVGEPPLKILGRMLDPETRLKLQKRNSPNPSQKVLFLDGHMNPGDSGVPILDGNNKVVGVGNGGLRFGSGIVWAILLQGVTWRSSMTLKSMSTLRNDQSVGLFAFPDEQIASEKNDRLRSLSPGQIEVLEKYFAKNARGKIIIDFIGNEPEAAKFVNQITIILKKFGWEIIRNQSGVVSYSIKGLSIKIHDNADIPVQAVILWNGLESINLVVNKYVDPTVVSGTVEFDVDGG